MEKSGKNLRRLLIAGVTFVLLALVVGVVFMIRGFLADTNGSKPRAVQQISLIKPPPPPPPPEKPPETPPEPKEEVKMDEPPPDQPKQDAPPPSGNLGLDANGQGDGDSFGLVGNKGGRDITIGGNGSRFSGYIGPVRDGLLDEFDHDDKLHKSKYKVVIAMWIDKNGKVDRYELRGSSGYPDIDTEIKKALSSMPAFAAPPSDMPQPVVMRLGSR